MGKSSYTPEQQAAWKSKHYLANKDKYFAWAKEGQKRKRLVILSAKDLPCADCGNWYPYYVMDFDHVRGKKSFNLASGNGRGMSLQTILAEIEKCDVVCANCHRERTHIRLCSATAAHSLGMGKVESPILSEGSILP